MARREPKPFITRIQSEGTTSEVTSEREETQKAARELAKKMPQDPAARIAYVREQLTRVFKGELDRDAFKAFVKATGCWYELDVCAARVKRMFRDLKGR